MIDKPFFGEGTRRVGGVLILKKWVEINLDDSRGKEKALKKFVSKGFADRAVFYFRMISFSLLVSVPLA